jgi:hypothetical protein
MQACFSKADVAGESGGGMFNQTDAKHAASELAAAGVSAHPWDEMSGSHVVGRCTFQSGSTMHTWFVDTDGHATQLGP